MKYKVGDKVKIRSDLVSDKYYGTNDFVEPMKKYLGEVATIISVGNYDYSIDIDDDSWYWTDEMFECKVDEPSDTTHDPVNHPSHYTHGGMECIDEMVALYGVEEVKSFCKLNVHKYRKRALYKNKEEDLKKADWYMNKYVELSNAG